MSKFRIFAVILFIVLILLGIGLYLSQKPNSWFARFPFTLGLDLSGGTELVYRADVSQINPSDLNDAMATLRDVIERRVNIFGVSEPLVQTEEASVFAGRNDHRLLVELPGVTDINQAVQMIGQTPLLEFKLLTKEGEAILQSGTTSESYFSDPKVFAPTGLTGRYIKRALVEFNSTTNQPVVGLEFNSEGADLFANITKDNIGRVLAIFLDGQAISLPVIQSEIRDGKAQISGSFTAQDAKLLVRNLNYGALPVPIELVGTQTIGATLGQDALKAGVKAGIWGFVLVVLFLVLWYRLPGLVASVALVMYIFISLALFKLIPVTLTAAGLAGFILSIGMAVDANILIFERLKEELKAGKPLAEAMREGFRRAWLSIRDSNISSIITAVVLFWLGTSAVKGFALTFGIGVLVSMFTAITASRTFLFAIAPKSNGPISRFLFSNGLHAKN